ncbi:serine protease [Stigmatella sp. ncwal1]|uniref:Serine protease n=1 Tax=Stigmatella ashevillensis TaxID=2995309 RepID=A0ABT5DF05_9BACT|nr:serine protease [Stigmatella ashevillena]MDC0712259.1 serine protease [Stigmatella ashevillena]
MRWWKRGIPLEKHSWLLAVLATTSVSCRDGSSSKASETLKEAKAAAVYGTDNRTDVYAYADSTLRNRAVQSTVALMHSGELNVSNPNNITFKAQTLGAAYNLCSGERFWSDPVPAFCSGTLIDDDLVLTAGHCIATAADCASTRFVFKFYKADYYSLATVTTADIFSCQDIVVRAQGVANGQTLDYAIVRLDRPATPRFAPAPLRAGSRPMGTGQKVAVIGASSGTPLKIDASGTVLEPNASVLDYFVAATDTFNGNSGAGVYEQGGSNLAGILVRGDKDYAYSSSTGSCRVARVCGELGCRGEDVTYVRPAIEAYCEAASSPRLCPPGEASPPPNTYDFIATHTQTAQQNTVNKKVSLAAGEKLFIGTCGMGSQLASASGDTYLRVFDPSGTEAASNDDACGSRASLIDFTAQSEGEHEIRVGCHGDESCSGTVAWGRYSMDGTHDYSASNTASATQNTINWDLHLLAGQTLTIGTCGVEGASGSGDTYLRLYGPAGTNVASNDDSCGGTLTKIIYTVPPDATGLYQVRAGCYSYGSCSGTVTWTIQ